MGAEESKPQQKQPISTQKFEIEFVKLKSYIELQRDRRQNDLNQKEKQFVNLINNNNRNIDDEYQKCSSICTDQKYIKAYNIIIRFCEILKDRSLELSKCNGKYSQIQICQPYIESLVWASKPINIESLQNFKNLSINYFGLEVQETANKGLNVIKLLFEVDPNLKRCFEELIPIQSDVRLTMLDLCKRLGINLQKLNEAGHNLTETQTQEQPIQQNTNQIQPNSFNQMNYPNINNQNQLQPNNFNQNIAQFNNQFPNQQNQFNPNQFNQNQIPQFDQKIPTYPQFNQQFPPQQQFIPQNQNLNNQGQQFFPNVQVAWPQGQQQFNQQNQGNQFNQQFQQQPNQIMQNQNNQQTPIDYQNMQKQFIKRIQVPNIDNKQPIKEQEKNPEPESKQIYISSQKRRTTQY